MGRLHELEEVDRLLNLLSPLFDEVEVVCVALEAAGNELSLGNSC